VIQRFNLASSRQRVDTEQDVIAFGRLRLQQDPLVVADDGCDF